MKYLKFLINLLRFNPFKVTLLVATIISIIDVSYQSNYIDVKRKVYNNFKIDDANYYVVKTKEVELISSKNEIEVKDGYATFQEFNDIKILMIILLIFCSSILGFTSGEYPWKLKQAWIQTLIKYVRLEVEDINSQSQWQYYVFNGKLLYKKKINVENFESPPRKILYELVERYLENPNLYLQFEGTKSGIRNNKIDNILK